MKLKGICFHRHIPMRLEPTEWVSTRKCEKIPFCGALKEIHFLRISYQSFLLEFPLKMENSGRMGNSGCTEVYMN